MTYKLADLRIPKALKAGDKIALVSSSWGGPAEFPEKYNYGKSALEREYCVKVMELPYTTAEAAFLEEHPELRAQDLIEAFHNPEIKGIISTIGGDDSLRILPFIDLEVIRSNCKVYLGYSDSTVTHFMCLKAGIRSYYGPSIMSGFAENGGLIPYMRDSIFKTLFSSGVIGLIGPNTCGYTVKQRKWGDSHLLELPRELMPAPAPYLLQGKGIIEGRLIGGCMETLEQLKASKLWPESIVWDGSILFLETSEDAPLPELVAEWMRDYAKRGILSRLSGIILGRPGGKKLEISDWKNLEMAIQEVVADNVGEHFPILARMDFGHTDPQIVLPFGALARIDCENATLSILEPGVAE